MLKKPITFEDFDGAERTEIHYFNLSKAELAQLEMTYDDGKGFLQFLRRAAMSDKTNPKLIVELFETLLRLTYGIRSEDGTRFFKGEHHYADFKATPAYSALFMELISDASAGATFLNGVMPVSLKQTDEQIQAALAMTPEQIQAELNKTTEQLVRERSESQMQGHMKKAGAEPQRVADPIMQPPAVPTPTFQPPIETLPPHMVPNPRFGGDPNVQIYEQAGPSGPIGIPSPQQEADAQYGRHILPPQAQ